VNIHHLELFYYVARHGGISEAVRHMPYGIQQPAVSDQVIQLEESLGVALYQRRPFLLTPAGKELYESIKPFFDSLTPMADKLRGGVSQHLRIAASEIVMRDYLPAVLQELRKQFPKLKVTLREGYDPEVIPCPVFGVLWQGRPTPVVNGLLDLVRRVTAELFRGEDPPLLLPGSEPARAGQDRGSSSPRHPTDA
jgi:hypothetical protein